MDEQLEVINDADEVIGLESRRSIHERGLLHREIHIWFMTLNREIIFQHRAKDKDTNPDKLDATVGGHVEPGMKYEETALKEAKEETGVTLDFDKLKLVSKLPMRIVDETTGLINNTIRSEYVYLFEGRVEDLQIEEGKALGFEAWKISSLLNLSEEDKNRFIPIILSEDYLELFKAGERIQNIYKSQT